MADSIAYVVGGSISHAEIREVEPAPPAPTQKPEQKQHQFQVKVEPNLTSIKPEPDLDLITPVDLTRSSTSFWSDSP